MWLDGTGKFHFLDDCYCYFLPRFVRSFQFLWDGVSISAGLCTYMECTGHVKDPLCLSTVQVVLNAIYHTAMAENATHIQT